MLPEGVSALYALRIAVTLPPELRAGGHYIKVKAMPVRQSAAFRLGFGGFDFLLVQLHLLYTLQVRSSCTTNAQQKAGIVWDVGGRLGTKVDIEGLFLRLAAPITLHETT